MTSARFGRMRVGGKCAKERIGKESCGVDVMDILDAECSGRRDCSFKVFEKLGHLKPCSEAVSYLEVTYECMPGRPIALLQSENYHLVLMR